MSSGEIVILHISDTHLGSRRYNRDSREQDVYDVFSQLIDVAIREHVRAIVHSGDLFDVYKPGNKSLKFFVDKVKILRDKGIDFINIPGDHDTPKVRDEVYTQRLLGESLGLIKMLLGDQDPRYVEIDDGGVKVRVYGIRSMSTVFRDNLLNLLNSLKPEGERNVLMLHQGFREMLPYDNAWQLEIGSLPRGFQYYACGHLHSRDTRVLPWGGILAVAGSPEIIREEEIEGWMKNGKGGYLVDLSKKEVEVHKVDVDVRPQEVVRINTATVEQDIENIKKKFNSKRKPILHVILEGDSSKRGIAMKRLSLLTEVAEFYRIYKDETTDSQVREVRAESKGTISELIADYLRKQGYNDEEVKLILEVISKYDSDEADEILKRFAEMER
ncbi:MAG: DNA double-strand break repair protein Mre11 [Metallosphaera javensis (ex Sakai et al. 2022)]|nr:MAG: DNA double-strand break repair protein Mre11 [Metallosphaera javensis (ex Sakai et al. 2022)]